MGVLPFAVVPVLPTLQALSVILSIAAVSLLGALASLRHPAVVRQIAQLCWRQKVAILLLATVTVILVWLVISLRWPTPDLTRKVGADWFTSRGDLAQSGTVPDAKGPTVGGVIWSAGGRGEAFYSSPAVVANRVYAVGSQGQRGRIHAFDLETGRQLWSCRPPGYVATFSSPSSLATCWFAARECITTRWPGWCVLTSRPGRLPGHSPRTATSSVPLPWTEAAFTSEPATTVCIVSSWTRMSPMTVAWCGMHPELDTPMRRRRWPCRTVGSTWGWDWAVRRSAVSTPTRVQSWGGWPCRIPCLAHHPSSRANCTLEWGSAII